MDTKIEYAAKGFPQDCYLIIFWQIQIGKVLNQFQLLWKHFDSVLQIPVIICAMTLY